MRAAMISNLMSSGVWITSKPEFRLSIVGEFKKTLTVQHTKSSVAKHDKANQVKGSSQSH
jgi:hypothetical protein